MARKTPFPTIPEKSPGQAKPGRSRVIPKRGAELSLKQFDLWDAFAASPDQDSAAEPGPKHRARVRQRRGSGGT
jgi:hypothetical protein